MTGSSSSGRSSKALPLDNLSLHQPTGGGGEDDQCAIAPEAAANDETPTVISKRQQAEVVAEQAGNSIRGRTLAHFELIQPIGVGGMAAVLLARDKQLDRTVALKILPPDMAADPENIRRFHQEARAAAKLDHENIARVFFCGEEQRLHFIAFEYVEGENLRNVLERRGRLPVAEAVRYILQIAAGLEHAASRGVVHRDIKPSNIIVSPTGRAKLVDMGLARSLERREEKGVTHSGVTLGTFDYISPEQALEPREADVRSDIYSLGCTFYHMVTGQSPVPEGTAAKKLHHHQHVSPVDPRQLNPSIPDEVAAILQRMMAKDPKDRYQHPLHLIQHLMEVAQKVGAGADVPGGVIFVDAPLPSPPRKKPALVFGLAAVVLGLVLVALALTPPWPRTLMPGAKLPGAKVGEIGTNDSNRKTGGEKTPVNGAQPNFRPLQVTNEQELAQALREERPSLHVLIAHTITITDSGLFFQCLGDRTLTVESKSPAEPQTLRIKFQPRPEMFDSWAGLQIEGGNVSFKNLVFEIEGSGSTPEIPVAAVLVRSSSNHASKVSFRACKFVQKDIPARSFLPEDKQLVPVASVAVENQSGNTSDKPVVRFDECSFQDGQVAVSLNGPADITATNCAFFPHCALFHLRGDSKNFASELALDQCSAMLVRGPAFRLDDQASCKLNLTHCLFSRPEYTPDKRYDQADLIRQTDAQEPLVRFHGKRNGYHNLNAYWVWPTINGARLITSLEEFRDRVGQHQGQEDMASSHLTAKVNPWKSATPLREKDRDTFLVNPSLPEVRQLGNKKNRPLGIDTCLNWGPMPALADLVGHPNVGVASNPREKIVDPDAKLAAPYVFRRLSQAVALAEPGDVILVKHGKQREVEVDPIRLDQSDIDLTIKPYEGFRPILVLADTTDKDPAMFRLHDGKLHLDNLDIQLEPKKSFKAQAVVTMGGNGSCTLTSCTVTLRSDDHVPLSVVTLVDLDETMTMEQRGPLLFPKLRFQNSFVRGEGDLVDARASRPLDLEIDNSLLALAGSVLDVTALGPNRDLPSLPPAKIRLSRLSAFLAEPFLHLRSGKTGKGLVYTSVESARDCLFVGLHGKPLVHFDGLEASEQRMRDDFLEWKNAEHNAYCGFEKYLEQQPERLFLDEGFMPLRLDKDGWRLFTGEDEPKFSRAKFELPLWPLIPLSQALPAQCAPKAEFRRELQTYGANLDSIPKIQQQRPQDSTSFELPSIR